MKSILSMRQAQKPSFRFSNQTLSCTEYRQADAIMRDNSPQFKRHQAFLALGSNLGDRFSLIESACREMNRQGLHVIRTSALYETKAMYLADQQNFINGACEVA